ncbi:MAG TPA: DEAD/DEAH box helicase [Vicinamibacterales bacterium]|nr:DEAD/DEAH box helicase [Vicinamibacterales bacterium]
MTRRPAFVIPSAAVDRERALEEALAILAPEPRRRPDEIGGPVVTAVERLPPAEARYGEFPPDVDPRLVAALGARGIERPYVHQAEAWAQVRAGRHVVVTTPTASGKTLCYNGPVLDAILRDPSTRALYLFPTKALAQDQLAELEALAALLANDGGERIAVFTYDGDTPQDARRAIRDRAHVVLTNPDMLHTGILPHHPRWAKLLETLRFVVIDELHVYRGVFGSHLANILRRLARICRHYGSRPLFVCSSATIANPRELAERLTGEPFVHVERSGAPRGEKVFVFVNPPVVNAALGIRRSYLSEARRAAEVFLRRGLQVIVFAQSRLATEILTSYLKDAVRDADEAGAVRGYRGGYLPLRRREIERGLREGRVRAVVATSALELGVDIGALDAAVLAGYPGGIAATWQRAGRAGRRAGRSAAVLVASSDPIDQFVVRHPAYFFGASPEHALINPDNPHILVDHLKCAAFELPFAAGERFGELEVEPLMAILDEQGFVHFADGVWNWTHDSYPADAVSLRSVSSDNFVVIDVTRGEQVIGQTDFTSAPSTLHEKAIYMVEGELYQVERLDFEGRRAYVRRVACDYYTDAITYTKVSVLETFASDDGTGGGRAVRARRSHGEVHVVSRVVGFKKIRFHTNENVGSGELDLPEQQMHTTAYWLTIPGDVMAALGCPPDDRRDGVVGLAFALRHVAQLLLMCDRHDIGISVDGGGVERTLRGGPPPVLAPEPDIFVYDTYPGGIGFSEPLYALHATLLERTRELIAACPCPSGCPSCVGPEGQTGPNGKAVAARLLDLLLGATA